MSGWCPNCSCSRCKADRRLTRALILARELADKLTGREATGEEVAELVAAIHDGPDRTFEKRAISPVFVSQAAKPLQP